MVTKTLSIPTNGVRIPAATYVRAVSWIADNEPNNTGSIVFLQHASSVCLLAALAGVGTQRVAEDVIRHRKYG